jgi:hypothetical protein
MIRPSASDIAFLSRLVTEDEIARAFLPLADQRTARRLVEAHLAFRMKSSQRRRWCLMGWCAHWWSTG